MREPLGSFRPIANGWELGSEDKMVDIRDLTDEEGAAALAAILKYRKKNGKAEKDGDDPPPEGGPGDPK